MTLSIIYARSENHCIGQAGGMPWDLPDEFASFNRITSGHAIIMGRRTYEDHQSYLSNRLNIVLSRQAQYQVEAGVQCVRELDQALALGRAYSDETFIIGGAALIESELTHAQVVFETIVHERFDGDTFLTEFDFSDWDTSILAQHPIDSRHKHAFTIFKHSRVDGI